MLVKRKAKGSKARTTQNDKASNTTTDDTPVATTKASERFVNYKKAKQRMLVAVVVIAVVLVVSLKGMEQKTPEPIFFDTANLNDYETTDLQTLGKTLGNQQFFYADLSDIKQQISQLAWVDSVSVRRDWHRGIVVSVKPKKGVANFGSASLIDASGQVFVPANRRELNNPALTYLKSDEKLAKTAMTQMYKINEWFYPLGWHLNDVTLTARGTWLLRFDNGLRVTVDNERFDEKLYNLSNLLKQDNALSVKKNSIASIDLRYKNGFSVAYGDDSLDSL